MIVTLRRSGAPVASGLPALTPPLVSPGGVVPVVEMVKVSVSLHVPPAASVKVPVVLMVHTVPEAPVTVNERDEEGAAPDRGPTVQFGEVTPVIAPGRSPENVAWVDVPLVPEVGFSVTSGSPGASTSIWNVSDSVVPSACVVVNTSSQSPA